MNTKTASFKINTKNAREVGQLSFIEEKGAYVGVFTRAELVTSTKGTQGIEFDFKSEHGATAKYLSIWTSKNSGAELGGRKVIDAIMTCMGLREISAADATIKKWNHDTRADETVRATIFPELMGPKVGVVLVNEEYQPNAGGPTKWRLQLVTPFEAATRKIAAERLDSTPAIRLDQILERLKDRPIRNTGDSAPILRGPGQQKAATTTDSGFDNMDDDIPF